METFLFSRSLLHKLRFFLFAAILRRRLGLGWVAGGGAVWKMFSAVWNGMEQIGKSSLHNISFVLNFGTIWKVGNARVLLNCFTFNFVLHKLFVTAKLGVHSSQKYK